MEQIGLQLGQVLERNRLDRRIADSIDEHRRTIGVEMHEGVAQQLTGAMLMAEDLRRQLAAEILPSAAMAGRLVECMQEAQQQVCRLSRGLLPVEIDAHGLMSALEKLCATVKSQSGIETRFECRGDVLVDDNVAATHLYHIAQEAVRNAVEHSAAHTIIVSLEESDRKLILRVNDDGAGLPDGYDESEGLGFRVMRYRATLVAGAAIRIIRTRMRHDHYLRNSPGSFPIMNTTDTWPAGPAAKGERMTQTSTAPSRVTRVMIVDDHPIVREGYKRLIEGHDDLSVCAEAEELPEAIRLIRETSPHLVIIDLSLKGGSGLELIKEVKAMFPNVKMLVASMHDENLFAERMLRTGAMGYVSKQEACTQLTKAIFHVMRDKIFLSEAMTDRMLSRSVGSEAYLEKSPIETLSDRELEVFELIGQGGTTPRDRRKAATQPENGGNLSRKHQGKTQPRKRQRTHPPRRAMGPRRQLTRGASVSVPVIGHRDIFRSGSQAPAWEPIPSCIVRVVRRSCADRYGYSTSCDAKQSFEVRSQAERGKRDEAKLGILMKSRRSPRRGFSAILCELRGSALHESKTTTGRTCAGWYPLMSSLSHIPSRLSHHAQRI